MIQDNTFEVEAIIDKRIKFRKVEYLIKWRNYSNDQNTWEPTENLVNVKNLIEIFEETRGSSKLLGKKVSKASINKPSKSESENRQLHGDIDADIPKLILKAKVTNSNKKEFLCLVKWEDKRDGTVVLDSLVPSTALKNKYPKVLCDFLIENINFN